jgi:hypothetical protein
LNKRRLPLPQTASVPFEYRLATLRRSTTALGLDLSIGTLPARLPRMAATGQT